MSIGSVSDAPTEATLPPAILEIDRGLPGFPELSRLSLSTIDEYGIFVWLVAAEGSEVSFLAVNPFVYFPDYEVELSDLDQADLGAGETDELIVYCLVTVNEDRTAATANLLAPIVVNVTRSRAHQIILDADYDLRAPLPVPPGRTDVVDDGDRR